MLASLRSLLGPALDVPVEPDGEQAREWILQELSRPPYQAARPTWWDRLSEAFWDWLSSLDPRIDAAAQGPLLAILLLVVAGALVAAFVIFGLPRLNRRGTRSAALFGDEERRSAEELRRSARAAAASGDWALAIEDRYRALARSLTERALVSASPGTTAAGFARRAGAVFPLLADQLAVGGAVFDGVRYLGEAGSEEQYEALAALDDALAQTRPLLEDTGLSITGAAP